MASGFIQQRRWLGLTGTATQEELISVPARHMLHTAQIPVKRSGTGPLSAEPLAGDCQGTRSMRQNQLSRLPLPASGKHTANGLSLHSKAVSLSLQSKALDTQEGQIASSHPPAPTRDPYSQETCLHCRASLFLCSGPLPGASMVEPTLSAALERESPSARTSCQS